MNCTFNYKQHVFPLVSNFASCVKNPLSRVRSPSGKGLDYKNFRDWICATSKPYTHPHTPDSLCISISHPACNAQCRWLHSGQFEMSLEWSWSNYNGTRPLLPCLTCSPGPCSWYGKRISVGRGVRINSEFSGQDCSPAPSVRCSISVLWQEVCEIQGSWQK